MEYIAEVTGTFSIKVGCSKHITYDVCQVSFCESEMPVAVALRKIILTSVCCIQLHDTYRPVMLLNPYIYIYVIYF